MKRVAVIVGRFQAHVLTDGHKELINRVASNNDKIIVFIGTSPLKPDIKNPLPYNMRYYMVSSYIRGRYMIDFDINPIEDVFNIPLWSNNLDKYIKLLTRTDDSITLYGGRDSFKYTGIYPKKQIKSETTSSATELRNDIINNTDVSRISEDFRKGIIWAFGKMK